MIFITCFESDYPEFNHSLPFVLAQSDATVKTEPSEQFPVESTDEPPTKLPRSSDGSSK